MANTTNTNISLMDPTKFKINTQHFSPHDLSLFVDSIETITRLAREKEERKDHEKWLKLNNASKKFTTLPRISLLSNLDSSASSRDEADEELLLMENRKVPKTPNSEGSEYDETYFSAPSSAQTSPRHSVIDQKQLHKKLSNSIYSIVATSDSDESGVFPICTSQQDIYELQTVAMRPQSKVVTKYRSQSTKSRLLSMVRKKETNQIPTVKLISRRALDEYETLDMYQQEQKQQIMQAGLMQEKDKLSRFATLHLKKKSKLRFNIADGSTEERFLEKALRYLTL